MLYRPQVLLTVVTIILLCIEPYNLGIALYSFILNMLELKMQIYQVKLISKDFSGIITVKSNFHNSIFIYSEIFNYIQETMAIIFKIRCKTYTYCL